MLIKNSNKIFSVLFMMCFSMGQLFASETHNLLKNSGFESGTTGWESYGSKVSLDKSNKYSGTQALKITTGGTGQTTGVIPNIDAIDGNSTKYIYSGYYKNSGRVQTMSAGMIFYDSSWNVLGEHAEALAISSSYKKFEFTVAPPVGTTYVGTWVWTQAYTWFGYAFGATYVDDIKLFPQEYTQSPCSLLQNGTFEKNLSGWSIYSSETTQMPTGHESNRSIQLLEGGMDQMITLFDSGVDTYQLSGYYKTNGTPKGAWIGMNFYDANNALLLTKGIGLDTNDIFQKFVVNATTLKAAKSVQVWVWTEGGVNEGKLILDNLTLATSECFDYTVPSSLPPQGVAISDAPQFVVLGFDDNTIASVAVGDTTPGGIGWALEMFDGKTNGDGSDARGSFYMNTEGLTEYVQSSPADLKNALIELKDAGHELGNHTFDHHRGFSDAEIRGFNESQWIDAIVGVEQNLTNMVGVDPQNLVGFRSPYLIYNNNLLNVLKSRGYLYDCSIEEGHHAQYDGTNFRWPYQLNDGSPGHNESWNGNPENSNGVKIGSVEDMWEIPVYVLMIPKDNECATYGVESGLWNRIKTNMPYLHDYKITGFDFNLWYLAELKPVEVTAILKYNLDLRLKGNRAPMTFGAHTQYYNDWWADNYAQGTALEMQKAISDFVEYALTKPEVRIVPASDVIKWCQNPTAATQN